MRIFLILCLGLILLAGAGWLYIDHQINYVPENVETLQPYVEKPYPEQARRVKKRLSRELKSTGKATISAKDIETVMMAAIGKKSRIPVDNFIRKYKVEIREDAVEIAFMLDLKRIDALELPPRARKGLDLVLDVVPEDMLDAVYVAVRGLPVKVGDRVQFSDNSEIQVGGFTRKINELMQDARMVLGRDVLQKLKFKAFDIRDGKIIVSR